MFIEQISNIEHLFLCSLSLSRSLLYTMTIDFQGLERNFTYLSWSICCSFKMISFFQLKEKKLKEERKKGSKKCKVRFVSRIFLFFLFPSLFLRHHHLYIYSSRIKILVIYSLDIFCLPRKKKGTWIFFLFCYY